MDSHGERTDTGTETRKLQQVGGGTYTLSIPKAWADERDLSAGMELHLFSHADGSIVVRDADTDGSHLASVELAVEGDDPALVERTLRSAHTAGFETVRLVPRNVDGDGDSDSDSDSDRNANANTTATDASGEFTDAQRETARTVARAAVGTVRSSSGVIETHRMVGDELGTWPTSRPRRRTPGSTSPTNC